MGKSSSWTVSVCKKAGASCLPPTFSTPPSHRPVCAHPGSDSLQHPQRSSILFCSAQRGSPLRTVQTPGHYSGHLGTPAPCSGSMCSGVFSYKEPSGALVILPTPRLCRKAQAPAFLQVVAGGQPFHAGSHQSTCRPKEHRSTRFTSNTQRLKQNCSSLQSSDFCRSYHRTVASSCPQMHLILL